MSERKILIDTNIFIGLEDHKPVEPDFAELVRKCSEHNVRIFIHEAATQELERDKDADRRRISLTKINNFEQLKGIKLPKVSNLEEEFGAVLKQNDKIDIALIHAVKINAVDFLVTQDQGLHNRTKFSVLGKRIFEVYDALAWLRQTFEPTKVHLPFIEEKKAHEINFEDEMFDSLREGYPEFDVWWRDKCVRQHRSCWTMRIEGELAGVIVRKFVQNTLK